MEVAVLLSTVWLLATGWLVVALVYRRASRTERPNRPVPERSVVKWQVGRWDTRNAGRLYVANVGEDTAHQVSIMARDVHDTVTLKVDQVPPYQPGDDRSPEPCYVDFFLKYRSVHGPDPTEAAGEFRPTTVSPEAISSRQVSEEINRRPRGASVEVDERRQVEVRITWRSQQGRWSTETLHTG